MSHAMAMILNALITGREDMRDAALLQWHYALGMNALDTCFVTGFGEKSVLHPHHRPSGADDVEAPVPGLISGGPNKRFPYTATREKLGEDTPPCSSPIPGKLIPGKNITSSTKREICPCIAAKN